MIVTTLRSATQTLLCIMLALTPSLTVLHADDDDDDERVDDPFLQLILDFEEVEEEAREGEWDEAQEYLEKAQKTKEHPEFKKLIKGEDMTTLNRVVKTLKRSIDAKSVTRVEAVQRGLMKHLVKVYSDPKVNKQNLFTRKYARDVQQLRDNFNDGNKKLLLAEVGEIISHFDNFQKEFPQLAKTAPVTLEELKNLRKAVKAEPMDKATADKIISAFQKRAN